MTKKHSELREWQIALPNPPYRYIPDSATIVSSEGTTIASIGGDLKLHELEPAGEFLAHCANRLPSLISAADKFSEHLRALCVREKVDVNFELWDELHNQIAIARAEHLADGIQPL